MQEHAGPATLPAGTSQRSDNQLPQYRLLWRKRPQEPAVLVAVSECDLDSAREICRALRRIVARIKSEAQRQIGTLGRVIDTQEGPQARLPRTAADLDEVPVARLDLRAVLTHFTQVVGHSGARPVHRHRCAGSLRGITRLDISDQRLQNNAGAERTQCNLDELTIAAPIRVVHDRAQHEAGVLPNSVKVLHRRAGDCETLGLTAFVPVPLTTIRPRPPRRQIRIESPGQLIKKQLERSLTPRLTGDHPQQLHDASRPGHRPGRERLYCTGG